MTDNIFENLTDEEQKKLWIYMIFNKDKIKEKTEQWTKEAEEAGVTLTEYLEHISPLHVEAIREMKESKEDRLNKLQAEIDYLKFQSRSLSERMENIEKQMKEDKEEQLKKLHAQVDYLKFQLRQKSF